MAEINYDLLRSGYILKSQDFIRIHGSPYTVIMSDISHKYYLDCPDGNDVVFAKLGLKDKKYQLARKFEPEVEDRGIFPEFKDLTNLTDFVVALIETTKFKVGDVVRVVEFDEDETYPFGFNDGMKGYSGVTATIG